MSKKLINIYIDYKIPFIKKYLGNSFPPLIYSYFKNNADYNIFSLSDKNLPAIDVCIIMNGGSHWTYKDLNLKNFHFFQLVLWAFPKYHRLFIFIFYLFKLPSDILFSRHFFENKSYEKHVSNLIKKNPNIKIIHRLDGIYQVICKVYGYDKTIKNLNKISHLTIYQSNYSKNSWEKGHNSIFGKTPTINPTNSLIFNNGVDTSIFNPNGKKIELKGKWRILNISASPSPKKGLFRVLELANSLKDNKDFFFYLIGNQEDDPLFGKYLKNYSNIKYLGSIKDRNLLSKYYRSCNIFLFPSEDDCSPNVILEAMSSGLPILTVDSGGIKELIEKDNLKCGLYIDDKNPVMSMQNIIKFHKTLKLNCLKIINRYHKNNIVGSQYDKAIKLLFNK